MAIPLRTDFDASGLRAWAKKTKDGPQARRLLALAAIYDGATRTEAAARSTSTTTTPMPNIEILLDGDGPRRRGDDPFPQS